MILCFVLKSIIYEYLDIFMNIIHHGHHKITFIGISLVISIELSYIKENINCAILHYRVML